MMQIAELPFPFWILISRSTTPWCLVQLTPSLATAFSTHQTAGEFLSQANNPTLEVRLVARVTLTVLLEEFELQGVTGISLDPDTDGKGTRIPFRTEEPA